MGTGYRHEERPDGFFVDLVIARPRITVHPVKPLSQYNIPALAQTLCEWGFKPSHAGRLLRCYYLHNGHLPLEGLDLPKGLRERLAAEFCLMQTHIALRQASADGTVKLLIQAADAQTVESVLMPDYREDRVAGCLSTQVGCAMGCDFCATTRAGFQRNLSAGEMVEQFFHLRREAAVAGRRLRTVVFMGMGEPMLNLDNVLEAVRHMACNELGAIGWRQITVSTVGLIPGIDRMAAANLNIHLAISLHAPDDATRGRLLPMAQHYPLSEVMAAADRYQAATARPVTLQYCLLAGINDSLAQADQLAMLLSNRRMHLNVLLYNATGPGPSGTNYHRPDDTTIDAFVARLHQRRVVAHIRRSRGGDIDAACGQLKARNAQ